MYGAEIIGRMEEFQQEVCLCDCEQSSSDAVLHENASPDDALDLSTKSNKVWDFEHSKQVSSRYFLDNLSMLSTFYKEKTHNQYFYSQKKSGGKVFQCPFCNKLLNDRHSLYKYKKAVHPDQYKPGTQTHMQCTLCKDYRYVCISSLPLFVRETRE